MTASECEPNAAPQAHMTVHAVSPMTRPKGVNDGERSEPLSPCNHGPNVVYFGVVPCLHPSRSVSFLRSLFAGRRLFLALGFVVLLFAAGHFAPVFAALAQVALLVVVALFALDVLMLYRVRDGVRARREMPDRLSNGDANVIRLFVENGYGFALHAEVIDELPFRFQIRDARHAVWVLPGEERQIRYTVRPVRRGAYEFGAVIVMAASPLRLAVRRYRFDEGREARVYPSFLQMRKYELLAISNRLEEVGVKKVRRLGHTMEFDHIREYVVGDDVRTVNWRATARRGGLMVNQYREERAQPVYCVLDMGRVMKMPFEGMSLLDYGINAALVLANIALLKEDRAGLITFSHELGPMLPARRKGGQIYKFQEILYNLDTDYLESDYARLVTHLRRNVRRRSLLLLFTNFETRSGMRRQLPYLRAMARSHVVVAVFFENTELRRLLASKPTDVEGVYVKTIAEKLAYEKREIVKELTRHGIQSILTPPEKLSVRTINKYLELKAQGVV